MSETAELNTTDQIISLIRRLFNDVTERDKEIAAQKRQLARNASQITALLDTNTRRGQRLTEYEAHITTLKQTNETRIVKMYDELWYVVSSMESDGTSYLVTTNGFKQATFINKHGELVLDTAHRGTWVKTKDVEGSTQTELREPEHEGEPPIWKAVMPAISRPIGTSPIDLSTAAGFQSGLNAARKRFNRKWTDDPSTDATPLATLRVLQTMTDEGRITDVERLSLACVCRDVYRDHHSREL